MFKPCYHHQGRSTKSQHKLRPLRVEVANVRCCAWFALVLGIHNQYIATKRQLYALDTMLLDPQNFEHENGLLGGMSIENMHDVVIRCGYELRTMPCMSEKLWLFLRELQRSDLEVGSKFLLLVTVKHHAICVSVNAEGKVCLTDQAGSCLLDQMPEDKRFGEWAICTKYMLFRFVPGHSDSARARAQAAVEAYAESTGVAFELRRRARRSAAQRARVVARAREHLALYRKENGDGRALAAGRGAEARRVVARAHRS
jgi:hypothetical protein